MKEGYNLLFLSILITIALGLILSVYAFRGRRAIFKVIAIFRQHNALGINDAKTLQELGLEERDFAQRIIRGRDFKQYALQILIKRGVIYVTEDGKLYMVGDKLDRYLI
jgi:hypothetical protein